MRDTYADLGSRYGEAMAAALNVLVGAAADAGNRDADTLAGIARATAGHRPLGGCREYDDA